MPRRVAVVGAGVAGLSSAHTLADHGLGAVVFDKGGRPGGRLATRVAGSRSYDHGAPYFTVRDPRFERHVRSWIDSGVVAKWQARIVEVQGGRRMPVTERPPLYVGVPGMNSVAARLAVDCDVRGRVLIRRIVHRERRWFLKHDAGTAGPFDGVVVAVPAPQALPLLDAAPALRAQVAGVRMQASWALLLAFDSAVQVDFDGAFIEDGPLSWIARNGSKPGRTGETWVLHASAEWTLRHLEHDPDHVAACMTEAFASVAGTDLPEPIDLQVHRWRYAMPERPVPDPHLFDDRLGLAVCGDWCGGTMVEGAFLSGRSAAGRLLEWAANDPRGDRAKA